MQPTFTVSDVLERLSEDKDFREEFWEKAILEPLRILQKLTADSASDMEKRV